MNDDDVYVCTSVQHRHQHHRSHHYLLAVSTAPFLFIMMTMIAMTMAMTVTDCLYSVISSSMAEKCSLQQLCLWAALNASIAWRQASAAGRTIVCVVICESEWRWNEGKSLNYRTYRWQPQRRGSDSRSVCGRHDVREVQSALHRERQRHAHRVIALQQSAGSLYAANTSACRNTFHC